MTSLASGVRAIAGASLLAAVGLPAVILAIGTPIALVARTVEHALTWLTRAVGMTGSAVEAVVGLVSVVSGVLLFTWTARLLVRRWQRYARARGAAPSAA
jgi:hypothetical protein